MTALTRAQLTTEANTNLADNSSGDITAADVRQMTIDLADSAFILGSDDATDITGLAIVATSGLAEDVSYDPSGTPISATNVQDAITEIANGGGGSGSVTSVGLSLPAQFSVSGSPVTVSGTLTAAWVVQTANTVLAGPTSGGTAAPTFRALVGADLPNPSVSTKGGVQSYTAPANQFITQISTSGAVSSAQPSFSNLSGSVAAGQMPALSGAVTSSAGSTVTSFGSYGPGAVLANPTGGSAPPSDYPLSVVIDVIGSTRGSLLYRGASGWTILAPAASGTVLTSNGVGADPSYQAVVGTGTVTSVDASGGTTGMSFSGGPITSSGTLTMSGTLALANGGTGATTQGGARTALGLGTIATQAASSVAITGGSITGITDLAVADGGTGASTAAAARTNLDAAQNGVNSGVNTQTGTSYTLVIGDKGKLVIMSNAAPNTLTVPLNSSVAFGIGTEIDVQQGAAGQTSIAPEVGVTINSAGGALKARVQYSGISLVKTATNTWSMFGDITT
jgi:hypothetical protein